MIQIDIEQFTKDVKTMREAQNAYFKARKDPNATSEEVWTKFHEAKRLEKIVDEQLKEPEPTLFNF